MYEGLLCVCCLASEEDRLVDLFPQTSESVDEDYSRVLWDCLHIQVLCEDGHNYICVDCTTRLREVDGFRKQICSSLAVLRSSASSVRSDRGNKDTRIKKQKLDNSSENDDDNLLRRSRRIKRCGNNGDTIFKLKTKREKRNVPVILNKAKRLPPYQLDASNLVCRECPAKFRNLHTLAEHLNTHYRNYGCRMCEKAFMTKGGWSRHQRTHKTGPFPCKHCEKVFNNENTRMSHERLLHRHSDELPYVCRLCGVRFNTFYRRLAHMRDVHGNEDQYSCPHCDQTFLCSTWRSRHIHLKHKQEQYVCSLCQFTSKHKKQIQNHLANKHKVGEKPHGCDYCGKRFSRRAVLRDHIRSHLDDRQYVCDFCGNKFVQKAALKTHLQAHFNRNQITSEQLKNAQVEPREKVVSLDQVIAKMEEDNKDKKITPWEPVLDLEYEKYIGFKTGGLESKPVEEMAKDPEEYILGLKESLSSDLENTVVSDLEEHVGSVLEENVASDLKEHGSDLEEIVGSDVEYLQSDEDFLDFEMLSDE